MDQEKIWEYFQNEDDVGDAVFNARPRYEYVADRIDPGMRVLNIGVGRGGLETILIAKGVEVHSLDPGERSIQRLRDNLGMGDYAQVGFSQRIPFGDCYFDVVIMCEVLEHLADDVLQATIQEVRRVLKTGGRFVGTVPADENLLENRVMCPHCGMLFHRWGHLQSLSETRLRLLLANFERIRMSRHFFGEPRTLNWKGRLLLGSKKLLVRLGVKGSLESFFFSAVRS